MTSSWRISRDGQAGDARLLARHLERAAADSHTREPRGAFGCYLRGHNSVAAILELDAIYLDATYPEVNVFSCRSAAQRTYVPGSRRQLVRR